METLSQRQNIILNGVIETHIETTQPVGSRCVGEKYALPFSPATIRNEMGTLEEMGYLTHPHTSSGRIPTDHGYRYYLDHASFDEEIPACHFTKAMESLDFGNPNEEGEDFFDRVSLILSSLSQEIGLALMPFSDSLQERDARRKLSFQGISHIIEKPEFQNFRKIKALVGALEEKVTLAEWLLQHIQENRVSVSVGHEHHDEVLDDCAIVMARYAVLGSRRGVIAVLGPKRMPYRYIIPLVSKMAGVVGDILEHLEAEHS